MSWIFYLMTGAIFFCACALLGAGIYTATVWALERTYERRRHRHVFDSGVSSEQYGTLIVLGCKCGAGRVYAAK